MSQFDEYNHKVITSLQGRIRTLEEELRICQLERDNYRNKADIMNLLLKQQIEELETNIKNKKR